MKKKMTDSRLRAIARMIEQGMTTRAIATIAGLPLQSAGELVWIYKWSQEKLAEMIDRGKLVGEFGDVARHRVRKYFAMHPDQRPAPQVEHFSADQNKTAGDEARDLGNVHARLDLLARCSGDQNERLLEVEQRLNKLEDFADDAGPGERIEALDHGFDGLLSQIRNLSGRVDELERRVAVMHRDVAGLKQASCPEALPKTSDRLAKCEKQIARLQEILEAVARVLPAKMSV